MSIFSPTAAKRVSTNPERFSTDDCHAALDMIVNSERFSEAQVTKMQAAIEAELLKRTFAAAPLLTSEELLYGLNRVIWAIQESGRFEDAETMRGIRDRAFDFKAMGIES